MEGSAMSGLLELSIAGMGEEHLPDVARIESDSFTTPWSPSFFRKAIRDERIRSMVALAGGRVVGYAVFWVVGDFAELGDIAVDKPWRGKGIGDRLLREVIDACRVLGAKSIFLEVRASNSVAQGLYRKLGFTEIMKRNRYYTDPVEEAIVFGLDLEEAASGPGGRTLASMSGDR